MKLSAERETIVSSKVKYLEKDSALVETLYGWSILCFVARAVSRPVCNQTSQGGLCLLNLDFLDFFEGGGSEERLSSS